MISLETPAAPAVAAPPASRRLARVLSHAPGRRNRDVLAIAWLHGSLTAAVIRRQVVASWSSPTPVHSIEEFESALETMLGVLRFGGVEVSLVLEHALFVHQVEHAPPVSDSATRSYLRARVERHEKTSAPVLWISQRTAAARQEATYLLHLLPMDFYSRLNELLLARHLDLTRIVPLAVPLQLMLATFPAPKEQPVLIAVAAGDATTLVVARRDGPLIFARTLLARWEADATRIGVEVNRSLLYAKQQFGLTVTQISLLGGASEPARLAVQAHCGADKEVSLGTGTPLDWLQATARLSPRHPVNLVVGYLGRKRRRQFIRQAVLAGCWLLFGLVALDTWSRAGAWREEARHLQELRVNQPSLVAERDRLVRRNAEAERNRDFILQADGQRTPPVAARFLAYLGSSLPPDAYLTDFSVKWDDASRTWTFRLEGTMAGDAETVRERLAAFQKHAAKSSSHARFIDASRAAVPTPRAGTAPAPTQRFKLEGELLEK